VKFKEKIWGDFRVTDTLREYRKANVEKIKNDDRENLKTLSRYGTILHLRNGRKLKEDKHRARAAEVALLKAKTGAL